MEPSLPRPDFLPPGFGTLGHRDFVEIVVPPMVSYQPNTWGWYVLFALLGLLALAGITVGFLRYRHNAYRRAALAELATLRLSVAQRRNEALVLLPRLLKRTALGAYSRQGIATMSGASWHSFLERTAPGAVSERAKVALGILVLDSPTRLSDADVDEVFTGVARWIRRHRA